MPALVIFRNFTTRPFGGDDLHIVCIILGLYRLIQFICLAPLCIHYYIRRIRGGDIYINGIPPWCHIYDSHDILLLFLDDMDHYPLSYSAPGSDLVTKDELLSFERNNFGLLFVVLAIIYFAADLTWMCMMWSSASLGTPTETKERDKYLR